MSCYIITLPAVLFFLVIQPPIYPQVLLTVIDLLQQLLRSYGISYRC